MQLKGAGYIYPIEGSPVYISNWREPCIYIQLKGALYIYAIEGSRVYISNWGEPCLSIDISVYPFEGSPVTFILYLQIFFVKMAESFKEKSLNIFIDSWFIFFWIIPFSADCNTSSTPFLNRFSAKLACVYWGVFNLSFVY